MERSQKREVQSLPPRSVYHRRRKRKKKRRTIHIAFPLIRLLLALFLLLVIATVTSPIWLF